MSFKHNPRQKNLVFTNRVEKLLNAHPNGILPIVQVGEKVLRHECKDYTGELDPQLLRKLIFAMKVTMRNAPGVGLAATQIGLDYKIAVLEDTSVDENYDPAKNNDEKETKYLSFRTIINPHYEPIGDECRDFYEGCLSFNNFYAVRRRYHKIMAFWTDEKGRDRQEELSGWPARIFQHETDHLFGHIYIDKAIIRSICTSKNLVEYEYDSDIPKASKTLAFNLDDAMM